MNYCRSLFLLLTLISFNVSAQDSTVVRDFELWTGLSIKKSFLEKKLDIALTEEFRFKDDASSVNNYFTELEGSYELFEGFDLSLGYRYIRNNRKSGYQNLGRIYTDASYKHKIDRFTLNYRLRFQHQYQLGDSKSADEFAVNKYRLKFQASYNIKKWKLDPYVATEVFFTQTKNRINYLESITEDETKIHSFEKIRFTLGTEYKITKWMEAGVFYRIEREFMTYPLFYNTPATYYIAGLNLTFKL